MEFILWIILNHYILKDILNHYWMAIPDFYFSTCLKFIVRKINFGLFSKYNYDLF